MWKDSIRNIVVIFQTNILRIVGFYVSRLAIVIWGVAARSVVKTQKPYETINFCTELHEISLLSYFRFGNLQTHLRLVSSKKEREETVVV